LESNQPKGRKRRTKTPVPFANKLSRSIKKQFGRNKDGVYQWDIAFGIVLVIVLINAFILYLYWNIKGG
jgi:hypothetical protein